VLQVNALALVELPDDPFAEEPQSNPEILVPGVVTEADLPAVQAFPCVHEL